MDYTGTDFYCDVALKGKVTLQKEYESELVLAYHHTKPYWPLHLVIVPKKHIASFTALDAKDPVTLELLAVLKQLASKVEAEHGKARILTNLGEYQDSKHLHFHISAGAAIK
jgi:histidine triad (HIT) family protein